MAFYSRHNHLMDSGTTEQHFIHSHWTLSRFLVALNGSYHLILFERTAEVVALNAP